jgi:phage gpG-like protein
MAKPSSVWITLEVTDLATPTLEGMQSRLLDATEAMTEIQAIMIRSAQETFLAEGRPEPWEPLAESTKKRRRGQVYRILEDTGWLRESVSETSNQFSIRMIGPDHAFIGTNRPGAKNHQEGVTLPQRRFLVHQEQDIEDYTTTLYDFVLGRGQFAVEAL